MVAKNISVTVNITEAIDEAKKTLLNYNGEPLKPGEVLVPMIKDDLFIRTNVTNPDSIITISESGTYSTAVLVAVPEEYAAVVRSVNNLIINEDLGHYAAKKGAVSIDEVRDEFELELNAVPSFEDSLFESDAMEMTRKLFDPILKKSPKHAAAMLLHLAKVQGKEFEEAMQLGHDAANTIHKAVSIIDEVGIAGFDVANLKANRSSKDADYLKLAYKLLDDLINLI